MKTIEPNSKAVRSFFFWSGIIATIAYRIIFILNLYSQLWVTIAWYIGTAGFVVYFFHRFDIESKRARLVQEYDLISTVEKSKDVIGEKKEALLYLVKTGLTSKARWNSFFIFIASLIALFIGIFIDLYNLLK